MTKLTKKAMKQIEINKAIEELKTLLEKNNHTVYTKLLHISRTGMMRSLSIELEDGTDITDMVVLVGDYKWHNNTGGLKITGCGSDMGFEVVYGLSVILYCPDEYNHDMAYKLKHKWM